MTALPTGTVTFLFTDIEGSTRLLQQLGDRYAEVLAAHHRLLRSAIQDAHGHQMDAQGDALFVAFPRAKDALLAAVAAQRAIRAHSWPDGIILRVRMGLHTGEPLSGETGYVGLDVHRAARICAAGHGGQILLSQTTRELVADDLPEGVALQDLGEHRLKDLAHPHRLFQVVAVDLPAAFRALKSLNVLANNLPRQLTSFVGREREMAEVKRLLSAATLVTLTGSGGAGKTRLALQVAADLLDQYQDGVWLAELAALSDPVLVPKTVASALNAPEQPGRALTETLVDVLRSKTLLLVLDNCEHLLTACAQLVQVLLGACPGLRVVATSREPLGIPGEVIWRVPSLSAPASNASSPLEQLIQYEAIQLFVDRAALVSPGFRLKRDNAVLVAQVVQRLDGIPLAIELAAARVNSLPLATIAARLDDRFRLLAGSRTGLHRHQTLRATLDWSYELLGKQERSLLGRLSVFAGGFTLEAAEKVCAGDGIETNDVLDLLTHLVDKSLVVFDERDGLARYRLLESLRQYARDRLQESEGADDLRRRHRDWYLALVDQIHPELSRGQRSERLETEHDNLRAALEWSMARGDAAEEGLRLAAALWRFWELHEHFTEGRRWLEGFLDRSPAAPPSLRGAALNGAGILAYRQGDYGHVSTRCAEALAICEEAGDKRGTAQALHFLAHLLQVNGDYSRATEMMERSVALYREADDMAGMANSVDCLGEIARSRGDYGAAAALTMEALALYTKNGNVRGRAHTLHNLAYITLRQGDPNRARALFQESLGLAWEQGFKRDVVFALAGLAGASAGGMEPQWVARLLGAVEALLSRIEIRLEPAEQADFERSVSGVRARMSAEGFAAAWAEGRAMTLEQAVEYALAMKD